MSKDLLISLQCRSKFKTISLIALLLIILLHILLPGNIHQKHKLIKNHLDSIFSTKFDIDSIQENLLMLDQSDPQLIQYVRIRHMTPPSKLPYNLGSWRPPKRKDYKDEFSGWVANFFENKRNGIFIEAGANEGVVGSHTLYLEKVLNWTGILIECNPTVVPYLKSKHRNAWVADVCISPKTTPGILNFSNPTNWTYSGTLKKPWNIPKKTEWKFFEVQTIPLFTVIASLGWTEIDYFSFDIEGVELSVLKTFPFDKVIFRVLIIEVYFYNEMEKKELDELLKSNGYIFVKNIDIDMVYIHKSVKHLLQK